MRTRVWGLRQFSGAFLAVAWLLTALPAGAATVDLQATVEENHGRVILTFPGRTALPPWDGRIVNGIFVLSFGTTVETSTSNVLSALSGYVTVVRQDDDGTTLRFALARAVKVNTMVAGERLFVDFLPPDWEGPPPGLPPEVVAELARRAEAQLAAQQQADARRRSVENAGEVTLRVGRSPDFTRFDFRWTVPYRADFSRSGDNVTVRFDRLAPIDLAAIAANLPPLVEAVTSEDSPDGLIVRMKLTPSADVRAFRDGEAYIVDVVGEALDVEAMAQPGAPNPLAEAAELVTAPADVVMPEPHDEAAAGHDAAAPPADHAVADDHEPAAQAAGDTREFRPEPAPEDLPPMPAIADQPHPGDHPVETAHAPEPPVAPGEPPVLAAGPESGARTPAAPQVPVSAEVVGGAVRIQLPFDRPVSTAMFRRGGTLWLVLDTEDQIDLAGIRSALRERVSEITEIPLPGARALLMRLRGPELAVAAAEGNTWIVGIGDALMPPPERLTLERTVRDDGLRALRASYPQVGRVHDLADPVSGDRIVVVTGFGPARGLVAPQTFVELGTLASAQGLALLPMSDRLTVTAGDGEVRIEGPEGLAVSSGAASPEASRRADSGRPGFVDLARWERVAPEAFNDTVDELQAEVATSEEEARPEKRLELAGFYLSHELGPETLGLLRMAALESPELAAKDDFRLMVAAANLLAGRSGEAAKELRDESFNGNPDAAVWRTIAAAETEDWRTALGLAAVAEVAMADYPAFVRQDVLLAVARAALEEGSLATAERALGEVSGYPLDPARMAWRNLADGRLAEARGRTPEAEAAYRRAIAAGMGAAASEAEYRLANLGYKSGLMQPEEAVAALETLSIAWRGDSTELEALRLLGEIQAEEGHYREAFEASRTALLAGPDSPITRELQNHIQQVFEKLYLDGDADQLDPIQSLALYYDFREMTPVGRRGDAMVRKLADRLLSVDLVDQAAELLQHQVDQRLKGAARAQVAADLAVVYLVDGKPQQAMNVLRRTDQAELPALLERQRRLVEARILTETGNSEAALELLGTMAGDDVERLRIDAMWALKDWKRVATEIERAQGFRWSDPIPLSDGERSLVLRAAIAYVLADDPFGLERLRSKFAAKMADSPDAHAFETVTRPIDARGVEFRSVVREVAALDTLDAFLADYRQRYIQEPVAEIAAEPSPAEPAAPEPPAAEAAPVEAVPQASAEEPGHGDTPADPAAGDHAQPEAHAEDHPATDAEAGHG